MTRVPTAPDRDQQAARAHLTRLLVDMYDLPTEDRPRCWACSSLSLDQLRGGTTCTELGCQAVGAA